MKSVLHYYIAVCRPAANPLENLLEIKKVGCKQDLCCVKIIYCVLSKMHLNFYEKSTLEHIS